MLTCAIYECGKVVSPQSDYCNEHQDTYLRGRLPVLSTQIAVLRARVIELEGALVAIRDYATKDLPPEKSPLGNRLQMMLSMADNALSKSQLEKP